MKDKVLSFIKQYCNLSHPILLGLSGGPDSLALLYILLEIRSELSLNLKLSIAHVDHCWRKTSTEEANQLKELAEKLHLPFHIKTLDPTAFNGGNLEAICRQERLNFFNMLCKENGYQGVLLGHHADDQAETVLKKLFEGAPLSLLGGLQKEIIIQGMPIWRPLLEVHKWEILNWLEVRNLTAIEDHTNQDPRFMRGRFRTSIIPGLSKEFGKEIGPSLSRLAQESKELELYLQSQCQSLIHNVRTGPFGIMLDLTEECPKSPLVLRFLVRNLCLKAGVIFSHDLLENALRLIYDNVANKMVENAQAKLVIDRRRLFLITNEIPVFSGEMKIQPGNFQLGNWLLRVENHDGICSMPTSWREVWQGRAQVILPEGEYRFVNSSGVTSKESLTKRWTSAKIPAFMRQIVPVIQNKDNLVHEFLTGKSKGETSSSCLWKLQLEYLKN